jgi:hypothetical protein
MTRFAAIIPVVTLAAVAACVGPPSQPPQPRPVQRPTMAPPPVVAPAPVAAAEAAVAPGIWIYGNDERGSRALFGRAETDALVVVRCERPARRIFLSVRGSAPDTLTLRATSAVKAFAARPTGTANDYVAVEIAPTDAILDALAFSRGRFSVILGARVMTVPAWPELTRVVEDCRG